VPRMRQGAHVNADERRKRLERPQLGPGDAASFGRGIRRIGRLLATMPHYSCRGSEVQGLIPSDVGDQTLTLDYGRNFLTLRLPQQIV
jgi:hypothetical protein